MEQIMEAKTTKSNSKGMQKFKSIRLTLENQKKAERLLSLLNKKKHGGNIKINPLLSVALDLVSDEHCKKLQDQSLTSDERKELLRQKWIELHGPVSKKEFKDIMMTKEYIEFLSSPEVANLLFQKVA